MGIPAYFRNTVSEHPEIIRPVKNITIDYLFLDLNCAIHPCCSGEIDESLMYVNIIHKIRECVNLTGVRKQVFIAIDGPAPRMKMEQQRQRRLKSSQEMKPWDTNSITPGTLFMERLSVYISEKLSDHISVPFILSDSNEPGEGEHKIMRYMDTLSVSDTMCVYGLDADLLMLSMIRDHTIYLLRERTEYNIEGVEDEYVYCDISLLKTSVMQNIRRSYMNISNKVLLYDYLFICFFLGNDFIMPAPSVNIRYHGIQTLIDTYHKLHKEHFGLFYLLDNGELHMNNFVLFLKELSDNEYSHIMNIINIRDKQEKGCLRRYGRLYEKYKENIHLTDNDNYEDMVRNIPILSRDKERDVFSDNYQETYYTYNLYGQLSCGPELKRVLEDERINLAYDYIRSIHWTINYYFKGCISWKWYYRHHIPPLLSDVYKLCETLDSLDSVLEHDKEPYTPMEQLSIVLPKSSHNLIRDKQYMRGESYYPLRTPVHMFMKRYMWECHPHLPH